MPRPLLIALQFMTRLPLRLEPAPRPEELGRSLLWYPLVGVLLGGCLWLLNQILDAILDHGALPLRAGLILVVWVAATGAMHLDGLADSADAWMGASGNRERMLAIMKDPHVGSGAVTAVVLVLVLKFAALWSLLEAGQGVNLLLPPLLARTAILALFVSTPYARPGGIGSAHAAQLPRALAVVIAMLTLSGVLLLLRRSGVCAAVTAVLIFLLLRASFVRRLGGTTGDTAGAMIELIEAGVLAAMSLPWVTALPH